MLGTHPETRLGYTFVFSMEPRLHSSHFISYLCSSDLVAELSSSSTNSQSSLTNSVIDTSQMSSTNLARHASAESSHLSHLFRIHHLQEEIDALRARVEKGGVSMDELMGSLARIQCKYQQLSQDNRGCGQNLGRLDERYRDQVSGRIAKNQKTIETEVCVCMCMRVCV